MFYYETHLHTFPVSRCAKASVREVLSFYSGLSYDGVFITNHFLDGNINIDKSLSYRDKFQFYLSDYEEAKSFEKEMKLRVFFGVELSCGGTDFLVYGLDPEWYAAHPEIMDMKKSEELSFLMDCGALVIQAHPFREASYIDHIRLYPRCVHGVEVLNSCRSESENRMAKIYASHYSLLEFAGSDNHLGAKQGSLSGMAFSTPISDERDFTERILRGEGEIFFENLSPQPQK